MPPAYHTITSDNTPTLNVNDNLCRCKRALQRRLYDAELTRKETIAFSSQKMSLYHALRYR